MQISMRSFGLRRAGFTMLARTSSGCAAAVCRPFDVFAAGAMTALAVDALREFAGENGIAAGRLVSGGNLRNAVMAEHALVGDEAPGPRMLGIGARRHVPVPAPRPSRRFLPNTSRAAARSAFRAPCGAGTIAHGCPEPIT